jgi:hypothetical protein
LCFFSKSRVVCGRQTHTIILFDHPRQHMISLISIPSHTITYHPFNPFNPLNPFNNPTMPGNRRLPLVTCSYNYALEVQKSPFRSIQSSSSSLFRHFSASPSHFCKQRHIDIVIDIDNDIDIRRWSIVSSIIFHN